uniref:C2H2-type domain-containing protein n=1 Tax=Anopheles atroparvus TaxID=41427 RepID=A0A182JFI3_ANOAO
MDKRFVQRKSLPERPVRVRKCEFCETVLDCRVNVYSQHCLEEHDRSPYACPLCKAPFHLQSHLNEHVKTEHSLEEVESFIAQDLWREFTVKEGVRMAECRFCYRIISSQASRSNHAEQHRKEIWRFCSQCGGKHSEAFCSHPKPKYDARLEKLHCTQCDRWMSKKSFREHLVTHTKDRNFPCTVCKKTFKVQRTATRHIQNHINASNRRRRCYDCAAVLADEAEIPEHYRLEHPLLAPYRCPICGAGFHEKGLLADHCHTHSDDARRMVSIEAPLTSYQIGSARVFECTLCRRSFSTKRSTVAHLIVHTDRPFVCPQCNLSFRIEAMLAMHMVDVHQVKDVSISL